MFGDIAALTSMVLTIDNVHAECSGVITLDLIDPSGAALPAWEPGAHIDLHLPGAMVRQYSLCGDPADTGRYQVAVLRDPNSRGGSTYLHAQASKGMTMRVSLPRNHFPLTEAQSYVFVGGGIGVTPLLPMMLAAQRSDRPYRLAYAGRSRQSMAFLDQLADLPQTSLHISDEGSRLDVAQLLSDTLDDGVAVYGCGPQRLMAALAAHAEELGRSGQLHVEHFSGTVQELDGSQEREFEVELARGKRVIRVAPTQTILQAVKECGVDAPNSCAEGVCGSCEVRVLSGQVDHRDQILDGDERASNDVMMICCSRALCDRLVLDL